MNFLEEKFWVRTITGNPDTRPHGKYPSKRQQAKLEHFLCLARHYTHPYGTFSESQCHRGKTRAGTLQNRIKVLARALAIDAVEADPASQVLAVEHADGLVVGVDPERGQRRRARLVGHHALDHVRPVAAPRGEARMGSLDDRVVARDDHQFASARAPSA